MHDNQNIKLTPKDAVVFLNDYTPKVYELHIVLDDKDDTRLFYAFSTRLDRLNFMIYFNKHYMGVIKLMHTTEVKFNPRDVKRIVEELNESLVNSEGMICHYNTLKT